jgi:hypothetical protein
MTDFNINNLINENLDKEQKHQEVYNKILQKIYNKIKLTNKKKQYTILYEVPNYIFGHSLYNIKSCIVYIIYKLRKQGLFIKFTYPNILIISWEQTMRNSYHHVKQTNIQISNTQKEQTNYNKNLKYYNKLNNDLINNFQKNNLQDNELKEHISKLDNLNELSKYY